MNTSEWQQRRLGELITVKHGFAFLGAHFGNDGTHIVLTPGNFFEGGGFKAKTAKEKWYRGAIPPEYVLKEGDLIIAMTEQAEGLLGSSALIPQGSIYLHNQRLGLIQIRDRTQTDQHFVYYLFNSRTVRQQIRASATGTKIRHTAPSRIAEVSVRVPSLSAQQRIAGILLAYDELMDNCERRIGILEETVRALFREWFTDFRFPGHETVPFVTSVLGNIPEGWDGHFRDIVTIERDSLSPVDFPDELFEHYSIPAFDDGRQPVVEPGEAILSTKHYTDASMVLLSKLNPRIPRIWLPQPSGSFRAITSTEFLALKPAPGISREFVYAKCSSQAFSAQFGGLAIGTSTSHQRVTPDNLLALPCVVPNRETIGLFTARTAPVLALGQQLRSIVQNLRRTRDLLLPRLLSGDLILPAPTHSR